MQYNKFILRDNLIDIKTEVSNFKKVEVALRN
jgi:hypothetical protein